MTARGVTGWCGDRLRSARTAARLTQAQLARRLGVAPWTVWAWENTRSPTATNLAALAHALEVSSDWLAPIPEGHATLRDLRQRAGLTQRRAADRLGRAPSTVAQVEQGRWWPTDAPQWAALYQVNLDVFRRAWHHSNPP